MQKFLFLILMFTSVDLNSQIINRWFDVYKQKSYFYHDYRQNNLQSLDKDNLFLIEQNLNG